LINKEDNPEQKEKLINELKNIIKKHNENVQYGNFVSSIESFFALNKVS
jgi:hypothetical protein